MKSITLKKIFQTWWPLATSWLLMSFEGPLVTAIIARLAQPELNLAGFGSVSEPLRSLTTAPMLMILSASVALVQDQKSYQRISRFMFILAGIMTAVHALLAFTPLYFTVVRGLLGVPEEIVPLSRIGLMITLPLSLAIGYRRFQQGVMIRYGYSHVVAAGTFIRLGTVLLFSLVGYKLGTLSGVVVGSAALTAGMCAEALYSGWRVRPILRSIPKELDNRQELSWNSLILFYLPLVMTSLLNQVWKPLASAAISRMPDALGSLAVWPVLSGLIFLFQTPGTSYNEVVVALLDKPKSYRNLQKFAVILFSIISLLFLLVVCTPLSNFWFQTISALPDHLLSLANRAIWLMIPIPGIAVLISCYQGAVLFSHKTRGITEAVVIYLAAALIVLGIGIALKNVQGIYFGVAAFSIGQIFQTVWLWLRARPALKTVRERDLQLQD